MLPAFRWELWAVGKGQPRKSKVANRSGQEAVDKRGDLLSLRQTRFATATTRPKHLSVAQG